MDKFFEDNGFSHLLEIFKGKFESDCAPLFVIYVLSENARAWIIFILSTHLNFLAFSYVKFCFCSMFFMSQNIES